MTRPQTLPNETPRLKTGCGYLYLIDATDSEYPEFFLKLGKTGCCAACFLQALAKVCSLGLRRKLEKKDIVRMLKGVSCPSPMWNGNKQVLSCPDAVAQMLAGKVDDVTT